MKVLLVLTGRVHTIDCNPNNKDLASTSVQTSNAGLRMLKNIAKKLGGVFVAATALMAGQAHGASFVGSWDPAFGSPFYNLGWEGTVQFTVPDQCLTLGIERNRHRFQHRFLRQWWAGPYQCGGPFLTGSTTALPV